MRSLVPVLVGLFALASPSLAQQPPAPQQCFPREKLLAQRLQDHGEVPVASGLPAGGGVLEVLASPSGMSWTMIVHVPETGIACVVLNGEDWKAMLVPRPPMELLAP